MLKNRLIPVLILNDGQVVQSVQFKHTNVIHWKASTAIDFFNGWGADEIIVLDVSRTKEKRDMFYWIIDDLSKKCFCPLSVGGWIDTIDEASKLLKLGADKIIINTEAYIDMILIKHCANAFGSQCIIISIDSLSGCVWVDRGRLGMETNVIDWAKECEYLGAGEIFLNDIEYDGNRKGYNLSLISKVVRVVNIPVIAMGGVLNWQHLVEGLEAGASAVAAANQFHYVEQSTIKAKKYLKEKGMNVR